MSFASPPQKKRRLQRTLLDYFPLVQTNNSTTKEKKTKIISDNWLFGHLPIEVVHKSIFALLTVQDLTTLSYASRQSAALVDAYRGPLPYIVREELMPRKLSYVNLEEHRPPANCDYFDVSRSRTLRFLVKTHRHGVVQVEVKLGTTLWTEVGNQAFEAGPHALWVEVKIYRQVKLPRSNKMKRILFFENVVTYNDDEGSLFYYLEGYPKTPDEQFAQAMKRSCRSRRNNLPHANLSDDDEGEDEQPVSLAIEGQQRACAHYFFVCAKRIAASPSRFNLPNRDYLIEQGLPTSLERYLPSHYRMDHVQKYLGPSPEALWNHRKAPSSSFRRHFLRHTSRQTRDQHGQLTKEYQIHEIPWYTRWYPAPVVLYRRNLLQSLPQSTLFQNVVPFLNLYEVAALQVVSPGISRFLFPMIMALNNSVLETTTTTKKRRECDYGEVELLSTLATSAYADSSIQPRRCF